jgi:hypothetical protein
MKNQNLLLKKRALHGLSTLLLSREATFSLSQLGSRIAQALFDVVIKLVEIDIGKELRGQVAHWQAFL